MSPFSSRPATTELVATFPPVDTMTSVASETVAVESVWAMSIADVMGCDRVEYMLNVNDLVGEVRGVGEGAGAR